MRITVFVLILLFSAGVAAQSTALIKSKLVAQAFEDYAYEKPAARKFISLKGKKLMTKLNPLTYVAGTMMFIYQRGVSEQIQANCTYHISCSSYTKLCMERQGMLGGFFIGFNQFNNCFAGISKDYPRYKISSEGKVMNDPDQDE